LLVEDLGGGSPAEDLSGSVVQGVSDGLEVFGGPARQVGPLEVSPLGGLLSEQERLQVLETRLMRRDQLEHAMRTACQIISADEVIVVGAWL
jgi:hypothetical protein